MSMDNQESKCLSCGEVIHSHVDEVWLWEHESSGMDRQRGPMHARCADDSIDDDPTRWSKEEPPERPRGTTLPDTSPAANAIRREQVRYFLLHFPTPKEMRA